MFNIINTSSARIKTGLMLISAFFLVGLIDSFFIIWLVLGIMMIISVHEAMQLFKIDDDKIYLYVSLIWLAVLFYPKPEDLIFLSGIILASVLAYTKELNKQLFLPLMYPMASFLFLLSLYISFGIATLFWLVVIVIGADVGAYFVGKSMGETQFCETSPNKTLEGVLGGVTIASILGMLFAPSEISFFVSLIITIATAIASVFGDLFESYLKREADVKDSGDILPGHGGILDRIDGYLFAVIVMIVLLRQFS
ncbi:Phosphatidate cytidylyltransferase [hydrothermal vent metagenome]|uniref:Phosphatidate cytidylyltransferase n=1 Tax=hydrothermal vent metagenome TaxID=652676 RepID=A0A3B1E1L6_9ZZZZ